MRRAYAGGPQRLDITQPSSIAMDSTYFVTYFVEAVVLGLRQPSAGSFDVESGGAYVLAIAGREGRKITPRSPISTLASG